MSDEIKIFGPQHLSFESIFALSPPVVDESTLTFDQSALPLFDEEDRLIVLHRDAHFSGSFSAMLEYYQHEEAKGICEDISVERIEELAQIEKELGKNLSSLLFSDSDHSRITHAKMVSEHFSILASQDTPEGRFAAVILSEEPEDLEALAVLLHEKAELLIRLASSDFFADPLFPGYGTIPRVAITILMHMKCEEAIPKLFPLIGQTDFLTEEVLLQFFLHLGEPAKLFGVQQLIARPITLDNERAMLLLLKFLPDAELDRLFREQLQQVDSGRFHEYLLLGLDSRF